MTLKQGQYKVSEDSQFTTRTSVIRISVSPRVCLEVRYLKTDRSFSRWQNTLAFNGGPGRRWQDVSFHIWTGIRRTDSMEPKQDIVMHCSTRDRKWVFLLTAAVTSTNPNLDVSAILFDGNQLPHRYPVSRHRSHKAVDWTQRLIRFSRSFTLLCFSSRHIRRVTLNITVWRWHRQFTGYK